MKLKIINSHIIFNEEKLMKLEKRKLEKYLANAV